MLKRGNVMGTFKIDTLSWEEVYEKWNSLKWFGVPTDQLAAPIEPIVIHAASHICSAQPYNWRNNKTAERLRFSFQSEPNRNYTFQQHAGTIRTAELLANAESDEIRAAVWICATTFDMLQYLSYYESSVTTKNVFMVQQAALSFLMEKYRLCSTSDLWSPAMRSLVPHNYFNAILDEMREASVTTILNIIAMNALNIRNNYTIIRFNNENEV